MLKKVFADKGSKRLIVFIVVVILILVGVFFMSGGPEKTEKSSVRAAPHVASTQGKEVVPVQYLQNLQAADKARAEDARKTTSVSALPTIIASGDTGKLPVTPEPVIEEKKEEPVVAPKRPTPQSEQKAPVTTRSSSAPSSAKTAQPTIMQADPQLVKAMQAQMQAIANERILPATTITVYTATPPEKRAEAILSRSDAALAASVAPIVATEVSFRAPAAGTILYSRLIGRVNSDVPGPVVGEILQGPFSGARIIGAFKTTEEGAIISFKTMTVSYKDQRGQDQTAVVPIDSVAVDTTHLGTAVATDINDHMLSNVAMTFATSFIAGLGQAISNSGATIWQDSSGVSQRSNPTTDSGERMLEAAGVASGQVGRILSQKYGNRPTTVIVDAGTPFGLLFIGK